MTFEHMLLVGDSNNLSTKFFSQYVHSSLYFCKTAATCFFLTKVNSDSPKIITPPVIID